MTVSCNDRQHHLLHEITEVTTDSATAAFARSQCTDHVSTAALLAA